jgi:YidC/Oxa1 family membrane protein insertase
MLPELSEIKKTSKGGERSELILQLYKKHNVSPFAGLKPLLVVLIQLPILIALFHVLGSAYELNNTSFLWISNLAEPDHLFLFGTNIPLLGEYFNILPFLMALVTLLTFKLSPAPTAEKKDQKLQNIFLIGMTLMFFFLFYDFPSGLVLYWTFANIFHIAQQKLMNRTS